MSSEVNTDLLNAGAIITTGDINVSGNQITNVADPLTAQDVSTKAYTDLQSYLMSTTSRQERMIFLDHCIDGSSLIPFASVVSGAGAAVQTTATNTDASHPGVIEFDVGSTTTGRAAAVLGWFKIGDEFIFEASVYLAALSDATNEYDVIVGLGDTTDATGFSNGIWFSYDRNTSTNWIKNTANSASVTSTATTTAVTAAGWLNLKFVVNETLTTVTYYLNGTSIGTLTTTIPDNADALRAAIKIIGSAGTAARKMYLDYVYMNLKYP